MFDYRHYVPVLRWKKAEKLALEKLSMHDKRQLTPLVELTPPAGVPRHFQDPANMAEDIQIAWGAEPIFVDFALLGQDARVNGLLPVEHVCEEAAARKLSLIPVVRPDSSSVELSAVASIAGQSDGGVCIRLRPTELMLAGFPQMMEALRDTLRLPAASIDVVLDFEIVDKRYRSLRQLLPRVPRLAEWRTLTVLAGSFPRDLTGFSVGQHELPRYEWLGWTDQSVRRGDQLPRRPAFGDYTIQHPVFAHPPPRANVSASIRYASTEYWVIMRGEGVLNIGGPGYAQWPANAQLLAERPEFCGSDFSFGDAYIAKMAKQQEKSGNAYTWLLASINHHLALVAQQTASLPAF